MSGCFSSQSERYARAFATLRAENQALRKQLNEQTNDLIALHAKVEILKNHAHETNRNLTLSQKVISQEIAEAKRYRRKIRKERSHRKNLEMRCRSMAEQQRKLQGLEQDQDHEEQGDETSSA